MKKVIFIGNGSDIFADDLSEEIMEFAGDDPIRIRPSTQDDLDEEGIPLCHLDVCITVEKWRGPTA